MNESQPLAQSHLYTVRLWLEELGEGKTEWRGQCHHVLSGEIRYFRDWPALTSFLLALVPTGEDEPGVR
jgi:hypothetical protein